MIAQNLKGRLRHSTRIEPGQNDRVRQTLSEIIERYGCITQRAQTLGGPVARPCAWATGGKPVPSVPWEQVWATRFGWPGSQSGTLVAARLTRRLVEHWPWRMRPRSGRESGRHASRDHRGRATPGPQTGTFPTHRRDRHPHVFDPGTPSGERPADRLAPTSSRPASGDPLKRSRPGSSDGLAWQRRGGIR
jgi:hypothetical protein